MQKLGKCFSKYPNTQIHKLLKYKRKIRKYSKKLGDHWVYILGLDHYLKYRIVVANA